MANLPQLSSFKFVAQLTIRNWKFPARRCTLNHQYRGLNALQGRIPNELVQLQSQAGWNIIGEHPVG